MNLYENRDNQNSKKRISREGLNQNSEKLLKKHGKAGKIPSGLFSRSSKSKAQSKIDKKGIWETLQWENFKT